MDDFEIEGNISIIFKDESSIFPLTKDENQEESDYPAMAEILNDFTLTNPIFFPSLFHFDKDVDWRANDDDLGMIYHKPYVIRSLYYLDLPGLRHIDFSEDLLRLVDNSPYSISDIIRIKDVRKEVKVNWISSTKCQLDNESSCIFFAGPILMADKLSYQNSNRAIDTTKPE